MTGLKLKTGTWVVVCDGRKAVVFDNIGDPEYPDLRIREAETHEAPRTSDMGTDAPGRVHQRFGESRSAVEQTDWHDREEEAFLKDLAAQLDKAVSDGKAMGLVIVAPPRALGMIRKAYTHAIKEALVAEIDKDYTNVPPDEVEARLVGKRS
ncbi:MAG: host attachment protein [Bauldia sp.]|nr:host attachment protein [Bauldia sp.]